MRARHLAMARFAVYGILIVSCLTPPVTRAQQSTAALNGTVRDSSGAVVPEARIVLTSLDTNMVQTAATNSTGIYSLVNIAPGNYSVEVTKAGFSLAREPRIALSVNQTATLDFTLTVGKASQTVQVSGAATNIEASTAELGTVINTKEVNDLPLNGRNFTRAVDSDTRRSPNQHRSKWWWVAGSAHWRIYISLRQRAAEP